MTSWISTHLYQNLKDNTVRAPGYKRHPTAVYLEAFGGSYPGAPSCCSSLSIAWGGGVCVCTITLALF